MKAIQTGRAIHQCMENLLLTEARPRRKPTATGGSDGRETYRSLLNSRKLRLPEDNLPSPDIGDDLGILVYRTIQH